MFKFFNWKMNRIQAACGNQKIQGRFPTNGERKCRKLILVRTSFCLYFEDIHMSLVFWVLHLLQYYIQMKSEVMHTSPRLNILYMKIYLKLCTIPSQHQPNTLYIKIYLKLCALLTQHPVNKDISSLGCENLGYPNENIFH